MRCAHVLNGIKSGDESAFVAHRELYFMFVFHWLLTEFKVRVLRYHHPMLALPTPVPTLDLRRSIARFGRSSLARYTVTVYTYLPYLIV
jgi:hypothetical protein